MTLVQAGHEVWLERLATLEGEAKASWLLPVRKSAAARFGDLGFPTLRDEEWKYTDVRSIRDGSFAAPSSRSVATADLERLAFAGLDSYRLVFVDGLLDPTHSRVPDPESGVVVAGIADSLEAHRDALEGRLGVEASCEGHPFVALNTALFEDGVLVSVPTGVELDKPVVVVFVTSSHEAVACHPRLLVAIGRHASATVVEDWCSLGGAAGSFCNPVAEVFVEANARLEHYKIVRDEAPTSHVSTLAIRQQRDSRFTSHSYTFGGKLVRNDVHAWLDGEAIECTLNGLTIGVGSQHVDNHTRIVHAKPHCESHELYKAVLADRSHGVFNGKIYVAQDAQKTDAKQTNQALLLSGDAVMDTKPELEIYADDVKCTHGATIGQLEDESLFYLRSRGIDRANARRLLTYAFASDVVERGSLASVRDAVEEMIFTKLPGESPVRS